MIIMRVLCVSIWKKTNQNELMMFMANACLLNQGILKMYISRCRREYVNKVKLIWCYW